MLVKQSPLCFLARRFLSHLVFIVYYVRSYFPRLLYFLSITIYPRYRLHFISLRLAFHFIITCAERFFLCVLFFLLFTCQQRRLDEPHFGFARIRVTMSCAIFWSTPSSYRYRAQH
ncbi:unnamed protein product [Ixodes pacificus]